jgi:hypothetical protein
MLPAVVHVSVWLLSVSLPLQTYVVVAVAADVLPAVVHVSVWLLSVSLPLQT